MRAPALSWRRSCVEMTDTIPGDIRKLIVGIDEMVDLEDGTKRKSINFDNASTTPALLPVMQEVNEKMRMYGSIGRGFSQKSDYTADICDAVRRKILRFAGAGEADYSCFFVSNTTDGINKLASALIDDRDDIVLTTRMEHHSNDLPWRERCRVLCAETDALGRIRYDEIERLLRENEVKYVTVTAASNVTGYVTDVHLIAKMAHRFGARIIVDGAQITAHRSFSMQGTSEEEDIDFFVFSAHKMYAPYGGGAVVGLKSELELHMPKVYGGGTVLIVSDKAQHYDKPPRRYEAGSLNFPGIAALGKAIDFFAGTDFEKIREHEYILNRKLIDGLLGLGLTVYGDTEHIADKTGVVTFNDPETNSYLLAQKIASVGGAATRRGAFCAHPYVWRLMGIPDDEVIQYKKCADAGTPGMIRASFGIYNTEEEVDEFLQILPKAIEKVKEDQILSPVYAPEEF